MKGLKSDRRPQIGVVLSGGYSQNSIGVPPEPSAKSRSSSPVLSPLGNLENGPIRYYFYALERFKQAMGRPGSWGLGSSQPSKTPPSGCWSRKTVFSSCGCWTIR